MNDNPQLALFPDIVIIPGILAMLGLIMALLARRKHRNPWLWGTSGFFLFPIAIWVLAFMGYLCPMCKQALTKKQWKERICPDCGDLRTQDVRRAC